MVFIVGGGQISTNFMMDVLSTHSDDRVIIACDRGVAVCLDAGVMPDFCIGDFDSAPSDTISRVEKYGLNLIKLMPEKDDTDSEAALKLAFEKTTGDIIILGATGTRLDHVLGNFSLLAMGLKADRKVFILDETNRIQMIPPFETLSIKKTEQYGKYISVMPYMNSSKKVSLIGFKYPLVEADLDGFSTLTISNEIMDDSGKIINGDGYLLVMETKD